MMEGIGIALAVAGVIHAFRMAKRHLRGADVSTADSEWKSAAHKRIWEMERLQLRALAVIGIVAIVVLLLGIGMAPLWTFSAALGVAAAAAATMVAAMVVKIHAMARIIWREHDDDDSSHR